MGAPTNFPANTYAVMVLKNYADRVVDFLRSPLRPARGGRSGLDGADGWISCTQTLTSATALKLPRTLAAMHDKCEVEDISASTVATTMNDVRILHIPALTGVTRARRGYFLVLVPQTRRLVDEISPMARQNIAWIGSIQHSYQYSEDEAGMAQLSQKAWKKCQAHGFDCDKHFMRVECHPRQLLEPFCLALQTAAAATLLADNDAQEPTDPFEGQIPMTVSRSKCTHRLTVVLVKNGDDGNVGIKEKQSDNKTITPSSITAYWGLNDRSNSLLSVRLNHEASQEIIVRPCNNQTGEEPATENKIDLQTPLSRAYYKLEQVWTEFLEPLGEELLRHLQSGAGVDLGASPGGWTQVLAHSARLPVVVAVDPGKLAKRVLQQPSVRHVGSSLETTNYRKASGGLSYTVLVCDASTLWFSLLKKVQNNVLKRADWSLPAVFVMTLKLPFKTLGSVRRQVEQIYQHTPSILKSMAAEMYPNSNKVEPYFQIVHLMANSVSERTLIAVFDDRDRISSQLDE